MAGTSHISSNVSAAGTLAVAGVVTAATSVAIGGGTAVTKILKGTIALDPASIGTKANAVATLTITGAVAGDIVLICPGAAGFTSGIVVAGAWVSAADTVKVNVINMTGGTLDESSLTCDYILIRS